MHEVKTVIRHTALALQNSGDGEAEIKLSQRAVLNEVPHVKTTSDKWLFWADKESHRKGR